MRRRPAPLDVQCSRPRGSDRTVAERRADGRLHVSRRRFSLIAVVWSKRPTGGPSPN